MGEKSPRRKEILQEYKDRKTTGGVFSIANTATGEVWMGADFDLKACENRFQFSVMTDSCVFMRLQKQWKEYGAKAFVFQVMEEIEMKETQTREEFREDLKVLLELWLEKTGASKL
ncbi:GIY-YIG nuclease family protein [Youxingia wuxianensis]|uniref:GIY-YIG nuclease family protein n=1 Tax=Youxingia wuxianensis TaxID=2763678 RepID=A0A926EP37_9FIRM|nr:GIY-YIG nuclease family protein [Youxingia wuxianensis]MBC8585186.1 GIY-YIG nuclease family protein [Youxingia wuxianensis]